MKKAIVLLLVAVFVLSTVPAFATTDGKSTRKTGVSDSGQLTVQEAANRFGDWLVTLGKPASARKSDIDKRKSERGVK